MSVNLAVARPRFFAAAPRRRLASSRPEEHRRGRERIAFGHGRPAVLLREHVIPTRMRHGAS